MLDGDSNVAVVVTLT